MQSIETATGAYRLTTAVRLIAQGRATPHMVSALAVLILAPS